MIRVLYPKGRGYSPGALLILLLFPVLVQAQITLGARSVGLGQATVALADQEWAIFHNPATMAETGNHVSFYSIRYFGLTELTDVAFSGVYNLKSLTIGLGGHTYGDNNFRESRFRLAAAKNIKGIRLAAVLNYTNIAFGGDFGSGGALGADIGLNAKLTDGLWLGARARNINQPKLGNIDEDLTRDMAVGLSYQPLKKALVVTEVYKDVRFPVSFRGGIEISPVDVLQIRTGVTTEPATFSAGVGFIQPKWSVNVAAQRHEVAELGWSPGIDLSINW